MTNSIQNFKLSLSVLPIFSKVQLNFHFEGVPNTVHSTAKEIYDNNTSVSLMVCLSDMRAAVIPRKYYAIHLSYFISRNSYIARSLHFIRGDIALLEYTSKLCVRFTLS